MGIANKYNKVANLFDVNIEGMPYFKLKDLFEDNGADAKYIIRSMFISSKGNYDPAPIFVLDNLCVNIPAHLTETVKDMLKDEEAVEAIKGGKLGFIIYSYFDDTHKKTCYSVNFVDM